MSKRLFLILLLILVSSCGKINDDELKLVSSSIINGEDVEASDQIAQSTLEISSCSSTIISEDLVVTAAHCVSDLRLTLFGIKVKKYNFIFLNFTGLWNERSADIVLHPKYQGNAGENDIALIKLEKKLTNKSFKPVAILSPDYKLESNTELTIAGFGNQCATSSERCRAELINSLKKRKSTFEKYENKNLLLKQIFGEEGASHGDSGGPAYLVTQTELLLVGATSGQNRKLESVMYTNVSAYKNFIIESALKMNATPPTFKMPNE